MKKITLVVAALLMTWLVSADVNFLVWAGPSPDDGSISIDAGGKAPADGYEPDNFPADATAIGDGEGQSHTIHTDGDVDWLSVTVQTGEFLVVETSNLSGSNADTVLELYDSSCNPLTNDDDGGAGLASRMGWTATYDGLHYVKVRTYGGFYADCNDQGGGLADCYYEVTMTIRAGCDNPDGYEPDNTPAEASLMGDGQTQSHTIHADGDVDWLSVVLQTGDELTVETSNLYGTNDDTVLELYDGNCIVLTFDDDGGGDLASRLQWAATYSGVHYIKAWTYGGSEGYCNSGGGGPADCCYDVSVTVEACLEPDPPNDPSPSNEANCAPIDAVLSW
ncbi:MAG: pre-peptidase C-terminal domain-containing protein, partial [Planctomycetota bacterium]